MSGRGSSNHCRNRVNVTNRGGRGGESRVRIVAAVSVLDVREAPILRWLGLQSSRRVGVSSGKVSVAESRCGTSENGSTEPSKERDGMRGTVGGWRPVGTGAAEPPAVDEVAGDRLRGGWPILASRWASTVAENCSESNAGRGLAGGDVGCRSDVAAQQ